MKRFIILANKQRVPMLFCAVDMGKYPKTNFWHVLYQLKADEKCPFVTLRITAKKTDFTK